MTVRDLFVAAAIWAFGVAVATALFMPAITFVGPGYLALVAKQAIWCACAGAIPAAAYLIGRYAWSGGMKLE